MISEEIFKEIVLRVKSEWPDDKEMQKFCVSEEKEGYTKLQNLDFGDFADLKDEFISSARETFDAWNDIYDSVESEFSSYCELQSCTADGIEAKIIEDWKMDAKKEHEGYYLGQLEFVGQKVRKHASILTTRQQIDPIKTLLVELEQIVGNECYNGNIQNYGSWGELESEGRQFRYPVKFYTDKGEDKKWFVSPDIPSEELITGYYNFGANKLNIYRALFKVVSHLRAKYGLKV